MALCAGSQGAFRCVHGVAGMGLQASWPRAVPSTGFCRNAETLKQYVENGACHTRLSSGPLSPPSGPAPEVTWFKGSGVSVNSAELALSTDSAESGRPGARPCHWVVAGQSPPGPSRCLQQTRHSDSPWPPGRHYPGGRRL